MSRGWWCHTNLLDSLVRTRSRQEVWNYHHVLQSRLLTMIILVCFQVHSMMVDNQYGSDNSILFAHPIRHKIAKNDSCLVINLWHKESSICNSYYTRRQVTIACGFERNWKWLHCKEYLHSCHEGPDYACQEIALMDCNILLR